MSGEIPRAERAANGSLGQKTGNFEQFSATWEQFERSVMKMTG